jgi:hypothetical protein
MRGSAVLLCCAATLLLFGNLLVARLLVLGLSSWGKTLALAFIMLATLMLDRLSLGARAARWFLQVRYASWFLAVGTAIFHEHYSVIPRHLLLLIFLAAVCLDAFSHRAWLAGPSLSAFVVVLVLGVADVLLPRLNEQVAITTTGSGCSVRDSILGYRPAPSCTCRVVGRWRGRVVYDAVYTTDRLGRRVVIDTSGEVGATKHAMFMGCSFVFGDLVDDEETLPSQFASLTEGYSVYNYGFSGYGPQQMYARLLSGALPTEVPQHTGLMVYFMLPDHLDRLLGTYSTLHLGRRRFPRFVLQRGELRWVGSFESSQPLKVRAFDLLGSSPTLNRLALLVDSYVRPHLDVDPLVALIEESAKAYSRQFDGSFYVCLWPSPGPDDRTLRICRAIMDRNIPLIELVSEGVPVPGPTFMVPHDIHPNGSYYRLTAKALARALSDTGIG